MSKEKQIIELTRSSITSIRDKDVILDSDLARIYGEATKRINERVKRNIGKFPEDFRFQLTQEEFDSLESQIATSKRGGRTYLPYAYTEHGVLQIANLINSELADSISVFVIRAFVEMREVLALKTKITGNETHPKKEAGKKLSKFLKDIGPKLEQTLENVMDTVVNSKTGTTLGQEGQDLIVESIAHLKSKLKKSGLENEEIAANITKLLAEAQKERAETRRINAESEQLEFLTMIRKLKLVLEARKLYYIENENKEEMQKIDSFVSLLKDYTALK